VVVGRVADAEVACDACAFDEPSPALVTAEVAGDLLATGKRAISATMGHQHRRRAHPSHEPLISEEDWVKANVSLIQELGPETYLRNLLSILKGNYPRG